MIEINEISNGFSIKFPFELKDAFKAAFKSAKWNADYKRWEVGLRSLARLQAWKSEAELAAESVLAMDEANLVNEDLKNVQRELDRVIADTGKLDDLKASTNIARRQLENAKAQLAKAKELKKAAEIALANERNAVVSKLNEVIDVDAVKDAINVMGKNMVPADRAKKERFEDARKTVKDARDKLRSAGFSCAVLELAAIANVNRPDRDNPLSIPESKWYELTDYLEDE